MLAGAPKDHATQVIVAANGCSDRTVEIAREAAPKALVLDIAEGSKPRAMNQASAQAKFHPRIYLDADVQCDYNSALALATELRKPGVMAASPAIKVDLSRSNRFINSYYRVWTTQPYVTNKMVGSGCYGLSREASERIGPFPIIIGDDIWVHSRFSEDERRNVSRDEDGREVFFVVSPPRTATDQIRVETRRRLGNQELLRLHPSPHYSGSNKATDLPRALKNGASVLDIVIYLGIKVLARLRIEIVKRRRKTIVWERDTAAREA